MTTLLAVREVIKRYQQVPVLNDVSFSIKSGDLFSILGPNGAGKSTLIAIILGLVKADSGQIKFQGREIADERTRYKEQLAVVFQTSILDRNLTVQRNLTLRAYFYTKNWQAAKSLATEKLSDVQGEHLSRKKYGVLSGGEKRKVDIARALLNSPQLLLLDEPTTGLDIIARSEMWRLIHQLKEKYGMTVVLTTHYMEEARDSACVLMLMDGCCVAYDSPTNLKAQYHVTTLEEVFLKVVTGEGE